MNTRNERDDDRFDSIFSGVSNRAPFPAKQLKSMVRSIRNPEILSRKAPMSHCWISNSFVPPLRRRLPISGKTAALMESMDFPAARCKRIAPRSKWVRILPPGSRADHVYSEMRIRSMVPATAVDTVKIMLFGENCVATAGKPESSSRSLSNELLPGRINLFVTGHGIEVVRLDSAHQLHRLALGWNQIEPAPGDHQRFRQSKDPVRNRVPMMAIIEKPRGIWRSRNSA